MIKYEVIPESSQLYVAFEGSDIGRCKFWLPEGIGTPRGSAGVYPHGMNWLESASGLRQEATVDQVFGPGNVKEVEPGVLECCGVRSVKEAPLPWTSSLAFADTRVDFSLSVHNPHAHALSDVCALLCLKFSHSFGKMCPIYQRKNLRKQTCYLYHICVSGFCWFCFWSNYYNQHRRRFIPLVKNIYFGQE